MDVQLYLRNGQIANVCNPQPQTFFTSLHPHEDESSRFVGQLDGASVIASDRPRFRIPEEIYKHRHLLLSTMKPPSHQGLADGVGDFHSAAAGLSSVSAAPGTSIHSDNSNADAPFFGIFSGFKIFDNPQTNFERVGYPWSGTPRVDPAVAPGTSRFQPAGDNLGSMFSFDSHIAGGIGTPHVDPAVAARASRFQPSGDYLGSRFSFDSRIAGGISSASQKHANSLFRALGTDQRCNNTSPLLRVPPEIQRTADLRAQLHHPLDSSLQARHGSQLPRETHALPQSTPNSKRRKFQYEWEKDDSWSRDEYDADDQDTASTEEVGKLQAHNLCIQPMDQARRSRVSWSIGKYCPPEGYISSGETQHSRRGTTERSAKSAHKSLKNKPKLRNAGEKSDAVASSSEEMMIWPPAVVIYNTRTEKSAEGLWDGMGGKEIDTYLNGLGHLQGKSKPEWGREGHKGLVLVKYKPNLSGLREAERLHKYFEENGRGRQQWRQINDSSDDTLEDGVDFVYVDPETNESKRILYGFLAGPSDLKNFGHASKIKFSVQSKSEVLSRQQLLERVN